jgi:hypothetical protein
MTKGAGVKKIAQMMLFCFTDINAEISVHISGYRFHAGRHILAQFCQMLLP